MPLKTGMLTLADMLANQAQSVAEFGLENANDAIQNDLDAHNAIVADILRDLADTTTDRQRLSGTSDTGEMVEVDETGRAPTQRPLGNLPVGFPLRKFQYAIGWTREWFRANSPADMARQVMAAQKAHLKALQRDLKRAIYGSANYTFRDRLQNPQLDLAVKRFLNADGSDVPEGPNGEVFLTTHQHYLANAGLTAGVATSAVNTVLEHGHGAGLRIAINVADEAAFRALSGFVELDDPRVNPSTATDSTIERLDITRSNNRKIGLFGAAEVWVKPWAIANYLFVYDAEDAAKPLVRRVRAGEPAAGLQVAAELELFPLHARYMEAHFGFGVWTRTNGAVVYFAGGAYTDPTIT